MGLPVVSVLCPFSLCLPELLTIVTAEIIHPHILIGMHIVHTNAQTFTDIKIVRHCPRTVGFAFGIGGEAILLAPGGLCESIIVLCGLPQLPWPARLPVEH